MKRFKLLLVCSVTALVSGCASNKYSVTYDSNPKGAEVFCNGQSYGYTPVTLYYTLDKQTKKNGVLRTSPCGVKWASGASGPSNIVFDLKEFPNGVITTTPRPDVDGYATDAEFALKVQQFKYQQAQDAAAANAQAWKDLNQAIKDATPKSTYTNCYGTYGGVNCASTSY